MSVESRSDLPLEKGRVPSERTPSLLHVPDGGGGRWVESLYPEVSCFLFVKFTEVLNQFSHLVFALCTEPKGQHLLISLILSPKLLLINLVQILWRRCL